MSDPKKIRTTGDGCVHDNDVAYLRSRPKVQRMVSTPWGVEERTFAQIKTHKGKPMLADVITGTLYDPQTGHSNSLVLHIVGLQ